MTKHPIFVTWQPVLTDHQAYTLEALAQQSDRSVIAYVTGIEHEDRKSQGWKETSVTSIERHLLPQRGTIRNILYRLREHRHDIHIFCSPFEKPRLILYLLVAAWMGVNFYIISEPYSPYIDGYFTDSEKTSRKLKSRLRPFVYRLYGLLIRRRVTGIFAISSLAVDQYRRVGVAPHKLFPFGYFVPRARRTDLATPWSRSSNLRMLFVGSLIQRKGVDLLIHTMQEFGRRGLNVTLDIYGPGDATAFPFDGDRLRYCGIIPFGQSQSVIERYDALIVPSRHDGWGVVVNEALCVGVPVLCSDAVGARVLVKRFGAGKIFQASNEPELSAAIESLALDLGVLAAMKRAAVEASKWIQPSVAAQYMLSVIEAEVADKTDVPSPWYDEAS